MKYFYFWARPIGDGRFDTSRVFTTKRAAESHGRRAGLAARGYTRYRIRRDRVGESLRMSPQGATLGAGVEVSNPRGVEIYEELLEIVARKRPGHHLNCDPACVRADHTYRHVFTSGPPVVGLEDKSLYIPAGD